MTESRLTYLNYFKVRQKNSLSKIIMECDKKSGSMPGSWHPRKHIFFNHFDAIK